MNELACWLLLQKAPRLGIKTLYKALSYFETPQNIIQTTHQHRENSKLFTKSTLDWLATAKENDVYSDLIWQEESNHHILTLIDPNYPDQLKQIADPPPILYTNGDISLLKTPQIAIVGSRNPSPSGLDNTDEFSKQLVNYGLTITSGLASGIDAQAHLGALALQQKTIAVCGTGLDRVYPSKHKNLAHQISQSGLLVSEFMIGTPAIANNFPKRNRIISGLSLGVLVVEAQIKSGSLITARLANEQGREVFAIPGSIHNLQASGTHKLIKQGASLVDCVGDIINTLNLISTIPINPIPTIKHKNQHKIQNILLKYLSDKPITVDELQGKTQLNLSQINQLLLSLELTQTIYHIPGRGFVLK